MEIECDFQSCCGENPMGHCPFCEIVAGHGEVSKVFEDEDVMALIPLHPVYPGACLVIPKVHIDHFTDIPDELAAQIMIVAQRIGRKIMTVYQPLRIGMLVHGFSVAHAHLHVIPQYDSLDIMHKHYPYIENGTAYFAEKDLPALTRSDLDALAAVIRLES